MEKSVKQSRKRASGGLRFANVSPMRLATLPGAPVASWTRGVRATHPDPMLMELAKTKPECVMAAVYLLVAAKRHPSGCMAEEVAGLRINMPKWFADVVEERFEAGT